MSIWFVRSNGRSLHAVKGTPLYRPDERVEEEFDLLDVCLKRQFVRIGWPETGDLRLPTWERRGVGTYGTRVLGPTQLQYLRRFAAIRAGDLILVPAGKVKHNVHMGRVVPHEFQSSSSTSRSGGQLAYHYQHDPSKGDWLEAAHRVDVTWARGDDGKHRVFSFENIGGLWPKAFGRVVTAAKTVQEEAARAGLI